MHAKARHERNGERDGNHISHSENEVFIKGCSDYMEAHTFPSYIENIFTLLHTLLGKVFLNLSYPNASSLSQTESHFFFHQVFLLPLSQTISMKIYFVTIALSRQKEKHNNL